MSKLLLRVIVKRWTSLHGSNLGFQHPDYRRAARQQCTADACRYFSPTGRHRDCSLGTDIVGTGPWAARADTVERKASREGFIEELLPALPIHPVTAAIALRTGQIDGENQAKGVRIPLADLLIGVTALELGYDVATRNVRHFHMIPGLSVMRF
jgi:predicted nucleic acid-binding protein